jgi:hypothetical protein
MRNRARWVTLPPDDPTARRQIGVRLVVLALLGLLARILSMVVR